MINDSDLRILKGWSSPIFGFCPNIYFERRRRGRETSVRIVLCNQVTVNRFPGDHRFVILEL